MQWPFKRKVIQNEVKKEFSIPSAPIIEALGRIKPTFLNINNRNEYSKIFSEVSEVYSVIMYMARAFSNFKPSLFKMDGDGTNNTEILSHPILDKLSSPNPLNNWTDFLINYYVNKKVQGNSYIYKYSPSGFNDIKNTGLWVLPAQYVYAMPNPNVKLSTYWNGDNKEEFVRGYSFYFNQIDLNTKPIWETRSIMHVKEPNLRLKQTEFFFDLLHGESPLATLTEPITNIRKAYEAQNVILKKRGALGILSPEPVKDQVATTIYTDKDKAKLQEQFQQYGLGEEDWQFIISNVAMKYQQMAVPVRELQLFEGIENSMIAICNTYNFPIVLLNYLKGATFSNVNELKKSLYQDNIIPEANAFMNELSNFLELPKQGLVLKPDFSHIPILQDDAKVEAEKDEIVIKSIALIQQQIFEGKLNYEQGLSQLQMILGFSEIESIKLINNINVNSDIEQNDDQQIQEG